MFVLDQVFIVVTSKYVNSLGCVLCLTDGRGWGYCCILCVIDVDSGVIGYDIV